MRNVKISLFLQKPSPAILKAKLDNRGLLYVAFDGRYKIGRYYAPTAVNTPKTLDDVLKNNDIQVFDLQSNPEEMHNLALEPEHDLALRMVYARSSALTRSSNVFVSKSGCTSIRRPPDSTTANPQLGSCCVGDFLAANSTRINRPVEEALLFFLFQRCFFR